ncbi:MAG: proprotein convertase P-domain-containing protein [Planctomycetota bacterium]|nr:proprotein convertase P-domain-containing protein [Planctomycetota bacterium]
MQFLLLFLLVLGLNSDLLCQALNDECVGATEAFLGSNSIDTSEATNSPEEIPTGTCPGTALGGVHADVWFIFNPLEDGLMTISTCNSVNFDTDVMVYSGACGDLTPVACHGDSADCLVQGTTNTWNTRLTDVPVEAGTSYMIRIGGYADYDFGEGTFEIFLGAAPPPPPGVPVHDECTEAVVAILGDNPIDTTNASNSSDPYSNSTGCSALGIMNQDVWYRWTVPQDGHLTVSTCGNIDFDSDLVIYSGSCASKIEIACSGDVSGCLVQGSGAPYASIVEAVQVSGGEELLFRIGGWGAGNAGSGTFSLQLVPALISAMTLDSIPGSASIDGSATLSGRCDSVRFSAGTGGSVQVEVQGPFGSGDVVSFTIDSPAIQTMVEVCASPIIGGAEGAGFCKSTAVTGPITLEGCSAPLIMIPDAGEPIESFIDITGDPATILWDLQVEAHINHPDASQLRVEISSPDGITLILHELPVGGSGSIDLTWWQNGDPQQPPYDQNGWMQPLEDLSVFAGANPIGPWTLSVTDEITGESGMLEEWCLRIYDTAPVPNSGQDLIIGDSNNLVMVGREGSHASFGSESVMCNGGTEPLDWFANPDPRHPMMAFNMFRLDSDRLIQIGGSWVKHGWSSAQANACGFGCNPSPTSTYTGVGCSDTYGAGGNANQNNMGPRSEIDPWSGGFIYEGSHLQADSGPWDQVEERLSVDDADLDPTLHPGSIWISEVSVVHPGDIDHTTNHAWEPIGVSGSPGGNWSMNMSSPSQLGTVQAAWPGASIEVVQAFPPIDGRCYLAHKVTDNGDGTWHYEYSLYNHDMGRNAGSFSIPVAADVEVSNIDFFAPTIHNVFFSNENWTAVRDVESITWSTTDHASGSTANPLRWGFLYNFGFDADAAPETGLAILGVHSPSAVPFIEAEVATPPTAPPPVLFRRGLCNADGNFDIGDVIFLLGYLFSSQAAPQCLDSCDSNDDGGLDIGDGISMLGSLFNGTTPPALPGPDQCGVDPTEDLLECSTPTPGCP